MIGCYRGVRWIQIRLKEAFPHMSTGGNSKAFFPLGETAGELLGDYFKTQSEMQEWIDKQLTEETLDQ